jgi:hypothetical protein
VYGKWGFRDSVNVDSGVVSGAYLSLDQGMIMAALGNELADDMLRRAFGFERALRPVVGVEEFGADPRGCTIRGTSGDDSLRGTGGDDVICAGGGDDRVAAGAGRDAVFGDAGDDELDGGLGDDTLYGDDGEDRLDGGPGDDVIIPGNGRDVVDCGPGVDTVEGSGPLDRISKNCEHVRH